MDRVYWQGANLVHSGIVYKQVEDTLYVRMDNGKIMLVDKASVLKWERL
jgi:hypothetical protein